LNFHPLTEKKKSVKVVSISAKVPSDIKEKAQYICEYYNTKLPEYIGKILENSEINKVYNSILKEQKAKKKEEHYDRNNTEIIEKY